MKIDLMRNANAMGGPMIRGASVDHPLTPQGMTKMRQAVGAYNRWDLIISSTLERCANFADELAERHSIPLTKLDELKDISFGSWEGNRIEQVDPQEYQNYCQDPINNHPGGSEAVNAFRERIANCWAGILESHANSDLLIITHGSVISTIIANVLSASPEAFARIDVKHAKVARIEFKEDFGPALERLNAVFR